MRKIYLYNGEQPKLSVHEFINHSNPKVKKKYNFVLKLIAEDKNCMREPYVKHFAIEKYKQLYELRLKAASAMVRIIFYEVDDVIILLHAFVKRNRRDTEQALEYSLKIIERLNREALNPLEQLEEVTIA